MIDTDHDNTTPFDPALAMRRRESSGSATAGQITRQHVTPMKLRGSLLGRPTTPWFGPAEHFSEERS